MANKWWTKSVDSDIRDIIIKLNIKLNNKSVDKDWTEDLSLDYENLDDDMEKMPSILAFWSAVLAEARKEKSLIDVKMDIRRAKVLDSLKDLIKDGIKFTVQDKENLVNVDPTYLTLRNKLINAELTVSKLFGIVDALKVKADNLRSFSAMKRAELHNS